MFKVSCAWLLLLTVMLGCSESGPHVVPVSGVMSLDGEPLNFKSLTLFPTDGTTGQGAGGYSDGEGRYSLLAIVPNATKDFHGCPPGKYRVVVGEPMIPITDADFASPSLLVESSDDPAPAVFLPEPGSKPKKKKAGDIPTVYTSEKTSPLIIEVAAGKETVNIELVSTAK